MTLRAASGFSGIGGAELALPDAAWLWSAEVDPFANAVRSHRLPGDTNLGDVLAPDFLDRAQALGPLDLLAGGPPCQDFSVAGLRAGSAGARGNLTLRWVQIIHAVRPRFALTENVPGWLSVNRGHAFGAFLAGLVGHDTALLPPKGAGGQWTRAGLVAGPLGRAAWRVLDAQHFGLAQRRQRVFAVFCAGDGDDPAAILFEPARLRRHSPAGSGTGEGIAPTLAARTRGGSGLGTDFDCDGGLIAAAVTASYAKHGGASAGKDSIARNILAFHENQRAEVTTSNTAGSLKVGGGKPGQGYPAVLAYGGNDTRGPIEVATARNAHAGPHGRLDFESETFVTHSLRADGFDASEDGTRRGTPLVAFQTSQSGTRTAETHATLDANNGSRRHNGVATASQVRRLTPTECERLMGVPDGWTDIPYRGRRAADGNRYRALGNSWAVPCAGWIMRRIAAAVQR